MVPVREMEGVIAGRLGLFLDNWLKVSQDQWILDAIQGYRIKFLREPVQTTRPRMGVSCSQKQSLVNEKI